MRLVRRVHAASSVDLLGAVPGTLDLRDDFAPHGGRAAESSAYDALRPRTLGDILDIAPGARADAYDDEFGDMR
jgi:hypothetical protein